MPTTIARPQHEKMIPATITTITSSVLKTASDVAPMLEELEAGTRPTSESALCAEESPEEPVDCAEFESSSDEIPSEDSSVLELPLSEWALLVAPEDDPVEDESAGPSHKPQVETPRSHHSGSGQVQSLPLQESARVQKPRNAALVAHPARTCMSGRSLYASGSTPDNWLSRISLIIVNHDPKRRGRQCLHPQQPLERSKLRGECAGEVILLDGADNVRNTWDEQGGTKSYNIASRGTLESTSTGSGPENKLWSNDTYWR